MFRDSNHTPITSLRAVSGAFYLYSPGTSSAFRIPFSRMTALSTLLRDPSPKMKTLDL